MTDIEVLLDDGAHIPVRSTFDVVYDESTILEKATFHDLPIETALALERNTEQLEVLHAELTLDTDSQDIEAFFIQVAQCPKTANLAQLTEYMNACIQAWLDIIDNIDTYTIIQIMRCITPKIQALSAPWVSFITDIVTETIYAYHQYQINHLLNYDAATHLPNTNLMLQDIAERTTQSQQTLSLFCMRFVIERGSVNVSPIIPSALNNHVLKIINHVFPNAHVYQNGDLLFSVIITQQLTEVQLNLLAVKIQHAFEQVIDIAHQAFIVSPVMCAIKTVNASESPATYYNQSRVALRYAFNRNEHFVLYTSAIAEKEENQKQLDLAVTSAFNNEELELYLQPIITVPNEKIIGAEVLLRWPNAKTSGIYPNVVVEIINKVGLGKLFTRWLIHSVCRLSHELRTKHDLDIYLTLNLRAEDLYDQELPHLLIKSAELWKVSSNDIMLEITENGILEENETTLRVIQQMTDYGFKLALDDFGTGYSSMARLRTLPISMIKIDQSFIKNIDNNKNDEDIVRSMTLLAISLGKDILVEGVENQASLAIIKSLGIPKAQGFHFSKPIPFDEFTQWAEANLAS